MFILDIMQDDFEDMKSIMRSLKEWRFAWPHDFTDDEVLSALKVLIDMNYVSVFEERNAQLESVVRPDTTDENLRRYWFVPTEQGRQVWRQWESPPLPPETNMNNE